MISLTPFLLMVFSALIVFILIQFKINLGRIWLVSSILSLMNWVFVLILFWQLPFQIRFENWFPVPGGVLSEGFAFSLDEYSWVFVFTICAIQTAILFSESTRITEVNVSNSWISIFIFSAFGILISISDNLLTVMIVWTLIDLVEFGIIQSTIFKVAQSRDAVVAFGVRLIGTLILIFGVLFSNIFNERLSFGEIPVNFGIVILISVGLRLGVFPFNLPYRRELPLRRGLGNNIRMVSVVSSVVVLNQFFINPISGNINYFVYLLVYLATLSSSILWVLSKNELDGRPFWIVASSGLIIINFLNGNQPGAISWGVTLMLIGSVLFLYSDRSKLLNVIPVFALLSMGGFPFSPNVEGWFGLINHRIGLTILNYLPVVFLIFGALLQTRKPGKPIGGNERWVWLVYPLGLSILIITYWLIFFVNLPSPISFRTLWISAPVLLFIVIFSILYFRVKPENQYSEWVRVSSERIVQFVSGLLRFDWLYQFVWGLYQIFQSIILRLSNILEGHGGMIWVFVLLALIITLLTPKG